MKIYFGQVYIQPGVRFGFSTKFQQLLSDRVSNCLVPSDYFIKRFGESVDIVINISAKRNIRQNEIKGPTLYKKSRTLEFTVFLPFDAIAVCDDLKLAALQFIVSGTIDALTSVQIETVAMETQQDTLIRELYSCD